MDEASQRRGRVISASITFTVAGQQAEQFKEKIREEAKKRSLSMSEFITDAIAAYLRNQNGQG